MKTKLFFTLLCLCIIYFACRKNNSEIAAARYQDPVKQGAADFITSQLNDEDLSLLDLNSIESFKISDTLTMMRISLKDKLNKEKVFLTYENSGYSGNWVKFNYKGSYETGTITTRSFDNELTREVSFVNGKPIKFTVTDHGKTNITVLRHTKTKLPGSNQVVTMQISEAVQVTEVPSSDGWLPPVTVYGYIYKSKQTLRNLYSTYYVNYKPGLKYSYSTTPPSEGAFDALTINAFSGPNAIGNIGDYNHCFDNVPGTDHKYTITICVDQPAASSRSSWAYSPGGSSGSASGGTPVDVGHTFLILTEVTPQKTITRNVGFYPYSGVSPVDPVDVGQLNNNEAHFYDVAVTATITSSQFFSALNFINGYSSKSYDLNNNNCTNFALGAMTAAGVNILATTGSWIGGSGKNPGDLGEDLRIMPLSSNMTRKTKYTSHSNRGNCY